MDRQRLKHFLPVLACGIILAAVSRIADEETLHRFLAWTLGGYVGFLLCSAVVRRQLRHRREMARIARGQNQAAPAHAPRTQGGESAPIRSLFLLGDDRPDLVSIDDHGTLQGWSRADGSLLGSGYPGRDSAFAILLAPSERHLLAISWDGQLRAFDLEAGSARTWGERVPYDPAYLHLLRETTWIGYAEEHRFRLLDWSTGLEWEATDQHRGPITSIASTRGVPLFATGARDGTIRVWDPLARTEPRIFSGHEHDIPAIAMDRTQNVIAGSAASGEIFVWDLDSALLRRRLPDSGGDVRFMLFLDEGRALLAVFATGRVVLWDWMEVEARELYPSGAPPLQSIQLSADESCLVLNGDADAAVWDVATRQLRGTLRGGAGGARAITLDRAAHRIAWLDRDGTIVITEGRTLALQHSFAVEGTEPVHLAWTANDQRLLAGCADGSVRCWEMGGGELLWNSRPHEEAVTAFATATGRARIFTTSRDGRLLGLDPDTGETMQEIGRHSDPIRCGWVLPQRSLLALGCAGGEVKLRNPSAANRAAVIARHAAAVTAMVGTDDDRNLISGAEDGSVLVSRLDRPGEIVTLAAAGSPVRALGVWEDLAVVGRDDGTLGWVDLADEGENGERPLERGAITCLVRNPHIDRVAVGTASGRVLLLDALEFDVVFDLHAHAGPVHGLAFDRAGERLFTAGADRMVRSFRARDGREVEGRALDTIPTALVADPSKRMLWVGTADGTLRGFSIRN